HNNFEDDGLYAWNLHVDWADTAKTRLEGPVKIVVAPYHYSGDGQLKKTVPQPGTDVRLDTQGDKLMGRVIYRRAGKQQSYVVVHSVRSPEGASGIRWYELRSDKHHRLQVYQQGTYA